VACMRIAIAGSLCAVFSPLLAYYNSIIYKNVLRRVLRWSPCCSLQTRHMCWLNIFKISWSSLFEVFIRMFWYMNDVCVCCLISRCNQKKIVTLLFISSLFSYHTSKYDRALQREFVAWSLRPYVARRFIQDHVMCLNSLWNQTLYYVLYSTW
jgi:hypothetical protein